MRRCSKILVCLLIIVFAIPTAAFTYSGAVPRDTFKIQSESKQNAGAKVEQLLGFYKPGNYSTQAQDWVEKDFPVSSGARSLFALDSQHVWVSGNSGTIWFFNGSNWTIQDNSSTRIESIWGSDASHVWAAASDKRILFFNGSSWVEQFTGPVNGYYGLCGLDQNHVWACGGRQVASYDGTNWTDTTTTGESLYDISAINASDIWAVGANNCIIKYNGSSWNPVTPPAASATYYAVRAIDDSHIWVGVNNSTGPYLYDGSSWTQVGDFGYMDWRTICSTSINNVWFQTLNTIYRYDGSSITQVGSSIGYNSLFDLSIAKDGTVWVTGYYGVYTLESISYGEISLCSPASCNQGREIMIDIHGENTSFKNGVSEATFSGEGITVDRTVVVSETEANAYITIDDNAPVGPRDVNVITGLEVPDPLKGGLTIIHPTFYFAEGTCRPGFDPYLCIQNPGDEDAQMTITYMRGDGNTTPQNVTVPAHSRVTVNPKAVLGEANDASHDFSTKIECLNGQVFLAERPMYFNYNGYSNLNWNGGHDVMGTTMPWHVFCFAEGTCRPGFDTYFCILNPNNEDARVHIRYILGSGSTNDQEISVPAHSRATVRAKDTLGEADDAAHDFSAMVSEVKRQNIVVERPMYFNYSGGRNCNWTGGSDVIGAPWLCTSVSFAEGTCRPGFDTYFCIMNPDGAPSPVTITYLKGDGSEETDEIEIPANSRATVNPKSVLGEGNDPAHDFSTIIESDNNQSFLVERPMYFNYQGNANLNWNGGHDVMGFYGSGNSAKFAEGTCRPGFETYFCILNANEEDSDVTITYMLGNGETVEQDLTVLARSRATVRVKDKLGEGNDEAHDFSAVVTTANADESILVERPMYFNYLGGYNHNWTGGSDVFGYYWSYE